MHASVVVITCGETNKVGEGDARVRCHVLCGGTRWVSMTRGRGTVAVECGGTRGESRVTTTHEGKASSSRVGGRTKWVRVRRLGGQSIVIVVACGGTRRGRGGIAVEWEGREGVTTTTTCVEGRTRTGTRRGRGGISIEWEGREVVTMTRGWVVIVVIVVCGGTDEDNVDEDEVGEEEAGTRRCRRRRIRRDEVGENTMRARPCRRRHMWRDKAMARHHYRRVWRDRLGDDGDSARMSFVFVWRGHVEGERTRRG
jgi:hypothetical protein